MRLSCALLVPLSLLALFACNAAGGDMNAVPGSAGPGASPPGSGSGGTAAVALNPDQLPPGARDPLDTRDLPTREQQCDANDVCTCIRMALIGTLESAALQTDTTPFVEWLNNNSEGTAKVTMVTGKPTLDDTFLGQYDVLLVANLGSNAGASYWQFSADEKAAVQRWVAAGGGIINLTGFFSKPEEVPNSSQLIEFAGVSYKAPETALASGEGLPVYYKGDTTKNLRSCLHWSFNAGITGEPPQGFITTPIKFTPQTGSMVNLTNALDYVGAFRGWSVNAPAGATVLATDPSPDPANPGLKNMAVAHEVDGKGRIFAFGDEWIIFKNQWVVDPNTHPDNQTPDQYNPCWVMPTADQAGFFHSVATIYQTKQFWYNVLKWVAPPNQCGFVIKDPEVVVY